MNSSFSGTDQLRLIKLLNLTTSPEDGEALSAARKANELLRRSNRTWESMLGTARQGAGSQGGTVDPSDMIEHLLLNLSKSAPIRGFVESLDLQLTRQGYLSEKQLLSLTRIYNNNVRGYSK